MPDEGVEPARHPGQHGVGQAGLGQRHGDPPDRLGIGAVDDTALDTQTDGYATSVVTLALQNAGGAASSDARVRKGLDWLRRHQDRSTGQWTATSLNKRRDPASDPGRFMNDAASAYAVLSLTTAR